jgi:hypothetical protein
MNHDPKTPVTDGATFKVPHGGARPSTEEERKHAPVFDPASIKKPPKDEKKDKS